VKVLITGAAGQVGSALLQRPPPDAHLLALTHAQCDIGDRVAVQAVITRFRPEVVINAAAYTAVDRAEDEPEMAAAINVRGPANLAHAVQTIPDGRLLHISSDYVFDGRSASPYRPDDAPHPLSVYGSTKLAGEQAVLEVLSQRAVVLRTAWVYAAQGRNFLLTMLRLMRERGTVSVVADQHGSPTSADSIASALWAIARRPDLHGVQHWTDAGADSWFGFACAIAEEAHAVGLLTARPAVTAITTAQYPTRAHRPANSVLDTTATVAALGFAPAPWRENLRAVLQRMTNPGEVN
jgi:dTDP-4-dehydrorhamnose reductase